MGVAQQPDRSRDVSQPLDRLGPDETLKANSDYLRGTIKESLVDESTAAVAAGDAKLMKFFGLYQQDDRDIRDERRRQKLEAAYFFMTRVRLPGGVCSPAQWLKLDELARTYGNATLRLTTRQTFQLHRVMKRDLRAVIQGLHEVLLDTKAACGDDTRGVMCTANPLLSKLHAQVYALAKQASDHATPTDPVVVPPNSNPTASRVRGLGSPFGHGIRDGDAPSAALQSPRVRRRRVIVPPVASP